VSSWARSRYIVMIHRLTAKFDSLPPFRRTSRVDSLPSSSHPRFTIILDDVARPDRVHLEEGIGPGRNLLGVLASLHVSRVIPPWLVFHGVRPDPGKGCPGEAARRRPPRGSILGPVRSSGEIWPGSTPPSRGPVEVTDEVKAVSPAVIAVPFRIGPPDGTPPPWTLQRTQGDMILDVVLCLRDDCIRPGRVLEQAGFNQALGIVEGLR
jgi:hypothetical protein